MFQTVDGTLSSSLLGAGGSRTTPHQDFWNDRVRSIRSPQLASFVKFTGTKTSTDQMEGVSDIMTNVEGSIMGLYRSGKKIFPSEIERKLQVSFSKREIVESLSGNVGLVATRESIESAKEDLKKAIDEIAKAENVQLNDCDREKLANFGILLLTKISSVV